MLLSEPAKGPALLCGPESEPASIIPATTYTPLDLKPIDTATLDQIGQDGTNWEGPHDVGGRTGVNDWLVQRYSAVVHAPALTQLPKQLLALPSAEHPSDDDFFARCKRSSNGEPEMPLRPVFPITGDNAVTSHSVFLKSDRGSSDTPLSYDIQAFTPDGLYGTKAEIERERFFIARGNQAEAIQALADKEFVDRAAEIVSWFQTRVRLNMPSLKRAIAAGSCMVPTRVQDPSAGTGFTNKSVIADRNILSVWRVHDETEPNTGWGLCQILADCHCGITKRYSWAYQCVEDSATCGRCVAIFSPIDASSLAHIAGLSIDELPDVLRHWHDETHFAATQATRSST